MKKKIVVGLIAVAVVAGVLVGRQQYMLYQTKKHSPASKALYSDSNITIEIDYCRPYKRGREIFGKLVPYGRWWRTGANEATQIELSRNISFSGDTLRAGLYSIVTIPEADEWTIAFNNRIPDWGTSYYPKDDELRVKGKVELLPEVVEQFTIDFSEENGMPVLIFAWDKTKVSVPFKVL